MSSTVKRFGEGNFSAIQCYTCSLLVRPTLRQPEVGRTQPKTSCIHKHRKL